MELGWRQEIRAEIFLKSFGPDLLPPIDIHIVGFTVESVYRFPIHCMNHYLVFDGKQKIQPGTKYSFGDRNKILNVLSQIELFVGHWPPYGSTYSAGARNVMISL